MIATLDRQDAKLQQTLDTMAPAVRYLANALGNGPWLSLDVHDPALPADDTLCSLAATPKGDCR